MTTPRACPRPSRPLRPLRCVAVRLAERRAFHRRRRSIAVIPEAASEKCEEGLSSSWSSWAQLLFVDLIG